MRWFTKKSAPDSPQAANPKAVAAAQQQQSQLREAVAAQQWEAVANQAQALLTFLRERRVPVTQSMMAELYGYQGLALAKQRQPQEAITLLNTARALLFQGHDEAQRWAESQGLRLEGEGEELPLPVAFELLQTLADSAVRVGQRGAGEILREVVELADMMGDQEARWQSRQRVAAFYAGMADWPQLYSYGRQLGALARQQQNIARLLVALRYIVEGATGMERLASAREVQQVVVEVARFLDDPQLASEEERLAALYAART